MSQQPWSPTAWKTAGVKMGTLMDGIWMCLMVFSLFFPMVSSWNPTNFDYPKHSKALGGNDLCFHWKNPVLKTIATTTTTTTTNPRYLNSKCFIIWLENSCCCSIELNSSVGNRALWTNVTQKGTEKEKKTDIIIDFLCICLPLNKKKVERFPKKKKTSQAFRGWG